MNAEEKLLIAKTEDLFRLCDKNCTAQFSFFLNEAEIALLKKEIGARVGYNCHYFGGYKDARRCMLGVFPEWCEPEDKIFPIKVIKIKKTFSKELSHRDYLGSVMANGITREQVGDILVDDDVAYIFITADMADFVCSGLSKIGNTGVKATVEAVSEIVPPEQKFQIINTVCASQRLDAVVASMLKLSRKDAAALIIGGSVSVNHLQVSDTSRTLKIDDIISVKGHGRYIFHSIGGETRSQRIHITVKKYI